MSKVVETTRQIGPSQVITALKHCNLKMMRCRIGSKNLKPD